MVILYLAKYLVYDCYCNQLKARYGEKLTLMATDTDSLMFYEETDDVYKDMIQNLHLFDTSNYPTDSPLYSLERKQTVGVMKDELGGIPLKEFVALRPKMYSFIYHKNDQEINEKRCKGVSKVVVKNELCHKQYKITLLDSSEIKSTMYQLRTDHHIMFCDKINTVSLSSFDDKRYWHNNAISSLGFGHYKLKQLPILSQKIASAPDHCWFVSNNIFEAFSDFQPNCI